MASTGTHTQISAHNGDIDVDSSIPGPIDITTHNGSIDVSKNGHPCPVVTSTHRGFERVRD